MNRQEAINIVKKNWPDSSFTSLKEALEFLIPELMSTDNEKIKEAIIKGIIYSAEEGCFCADNYSVKECVAWIEKQGEQEPAEYTLEQAANIFLGALSNTPYNNKPITDAQVITKELLKFLSNAHSYNPNAINGQKPADKVEPKFHEGDWVVSPNGVYWHIDAIQNDRYEVTADTGQCGNWPLDTNLYRLWTIQDAKDGDVLANKYGAIFINAGSSNGGGTLDCYCYLSVQNKFCIEEHKTGSWFYKDDIKPATKEQRDTLMKAMTDAGYTFDFDKKELKKIEQKPDTQHSTEWSVSDFRTWQYIVSDVLTKKDGIGQYLDSGECKKIAKYMQEEWSRKLGKEQTQEELRKGEDYGIDGLYHAISILEETLGKVDSYQSDDGILEHKCAIEAVNRLYKQKPAWSEEEHCIINGIIGYLCTHDSCELEGFDKWYDFLKSLKYRCLPQQQDWSEEDKRILSGLSGLVKDCYLNGGYALPTDEYDEYKKWLKSLKDRCIPQPKQEWSEEDETVLSNLIWALKEDMVLAGDRDTYTSWLEGLKNKVHPQPKQEWSEEDEKMLSDIEDCIKNLPIFYESININGKDKTTERFICDAINWFKCLKDRVQPQPHWKPSDEQIKAVKEAACYSSVFSEKTIDNLISLSEQLKKLK